MSWSWHWITFIVSFAVFTFIAQVARSATSWTYVAKYGSHVTYNRDLKSEYIGSVFAGAVYAMIATVITGFFL